MSLLEVEGIEAGYGPVTVIRDLSFTVDEGKVVTILGANGAGKTTTLRALSGIARAKGSVRFDGTELIGRAPEWIVRRGLAHVPEGRGNFAALTVEENLRLGALWRRGRTDRASALADTYRRFPLLAAARGRGASTLSGGERQILVIARALMARPRVLLLDEPSLGLAPKIVAQVMGLIRRLRDEAGLTVLLVEQNARSALAIADRGIVLNLGRVVAAEDAAVLAADVGLRKHYLGF